MTANGTKGNKVVANAMANERCLFAGEFVDVYKGHLELEPRSRKGQEVNEGHVVAVKALKHGADDRQRCELMNEAHVMSLLDMHPNVLPLLGVVTRCQPIMVVTEFMHNSSLHQFLQANIRLFYSTAMYISRTAQKTFHQTARVAWTKKQQPNETLPTPPRKLEFRIRAAA